jgi:predicted nucleotidyltransferase
MRLSEQHIKAIRAIVHEEAGAAAKVRVFGSRLNDERRGGDLDLLVELDAAVTNPAWIAASIEARISRALGGRSVDVVLDAPNLRHLPVHSVAEHEGVLL